jgi:hypothetical protein
MEPTYTILGSDGKQYGPVTMEQLRDWSRDGRIGADTQVWRSGTTAWVPAATLPELGIAAATTATGSAVPPLAGAVPSLIHGSVPGHDPELERRVKSGASWFYWIAGFSIVNSILVATGSQWGFALGLGITTVTDALAAGLGGAAQAVGVALNFIACGILVFFGFFAGKGRAWAFIIGMILLGLDTVLTGLLQMWLSLALHVFALFCIFAGFKASRAVRT